MSIMQEKDIENLIKRRDKINTKIEMLEEQNIKTKIEINELKLELEEIGVNATEDNIEELLQEYMQLRDEQYTELEKEVIKAEKEMENL